jgi:hypothetical protein
MIQVMGCAVSGRPLRYFRAVNEDKNLIVIILVNNGFFVTLVPHSGFRGNKEVPNPGATEVGANAKASPRCREI